jgi:hypothetical protein
MKDNSPGASVVSYLDGLSDSGAGWYASPQGNRLHFVESEADDAKKRTSAHRKEA